MKTISILLVDDHRVVVEGLRALLAAQADFKIVGEARNGRQALLLARATPPNIIIMDLAMPNLNGAAATRYLAQEVPSARVLILSSYADAQHVKMALHAGASGYILKHCAAKDLITAIRIVQDGKCFLSPDLLWAVGDLPITPGKPLPLPTALTIRQAEVLQLIAEGHPNKSIADEMNLSIKTIEKHRQQLMDKLGIHDIAGLTRYALSNCVSTEPQYWPCATVPQRRLPPPP